MKNKSKYKFDAAKMINDFYAQVEADKKLTINKNDISPEEIDELIKELDELAAFAQRTREMLEEDYPSV